MTKVDMSAAAVTTRLKRLAQLRRLGQSLQKIKVPPRARKSRINDQPAASSSKSDKNGNE